ncbi:hypothetical protein D1159_18805 [Pseudoflavonifractor sp. 524-17]|nr:hypothetical protein [Pseudoflavonifractor sp. 524-17]
MKCASKQDEIISSGQNFLKGKNVNKAGKIPTLPKRRDCQQSVSRFICGLVQISEMLFPEYGVHFIAVNDGVDSIRGDSEFTAIRNVFNEMFAKDTSKKIRATFQAKGRSGERLCTIPPYGYMKDPEDKKRWIVDEEAAAIVQKIFFLCVDGLGPTQIAKWLQQNNVLNPTAYAHEKGLPVCNAPTANPCKWTNETVSRILERVEYLGHTVNFKTSKPSFKSKKKVWNNPSEWVIFENTQEAIIEHRGKCVPGRTEHPAGQTPPDQDGGHGYVLRAGVLRRLQRQDVPLPGQPLQAGAGVLHLLHLPQRPYLVQDALHPPCSVGRNRTAEPAGSNFLCDAV